MPSAFSMTLGDCSDIQAWSLRSFWTQSAALTRSEFTAVHKSNWAWQACTAQLPQPV